MDCGLAVRSCRPGRVCTAVKPGPLTADPAALPPASIQQAISLATVQRSICNGVNGFRDSWTGRIGEKPTSQSDASGVETQPTEVPLPEEDTSTQDGLSVQQRSELFDVISVPDFAHSQVQSGSSFPHGAAFGEAPIAMASPLQRSCSQEFGAPSDQTAWEARLEQLCHNYKSAVQAEPAFAPTCDKLLAAALAQPTAPTKSSVTEKRNVSKMCSQFIIQGGDLSWQ